MEAVWGLTNIATGSEEQIQSIVSRQGIPILKKVLESPQEHNRYQAIWALSNVAGESNATRDAVLKEGVLPLVAAETRTANVPMLKGCSRCILNLCRGDPAPTFNAMLPGLGAMAELLRTQTDPTVLANAAWALSYMADGGGNKLGHIVGANVVAAAAKLLAHPDVQVALPCVRVLASVTTGSDEETQTVIDAGGLEALKHAMQSGFPNLRKESCWVVSNIAAGSASQTRQILEAGLLPVVAKILSHDDVKVQTEAAWIVTNLTNKMESSSIEWIVNSDLISLLPQLLKAEEATIVVLMLQFAKNALGHAKKHYGDKNVVVAKMEESCLDILEGLQYHKNQIVYKIVSEILEEYFIQDCDESVLTNESSEVGSVSIFNF